MCRRSWRSERISAENDARVDVCTGNSQTGKCAGVVSNEGNALRGSFKLELLQHFTAAIPYDAVGHDDEELARGAA